MKKTVCIAVVFLMLLASLTACAPEPKMPQIAIDVGQLVVGNTPAGTPVSVKVNGTEAVIEDSRWTEFDLATGEEPTFPEDSPFRPAEEASYSLELLVNMGIKLSEKDREKMSQDMFTVSDSINVDETYGVKCYWDDGLALDHGEEYLWVQVWFKAPILPDGATDETTGETTGGMAKKPWKPESGTKELNLVMKDIVGGESGLLSDGTKLKYIAENTFVTIGGSQALPIIDVAYALTSNHESLVGLFDYHYDDDPCFEVPPFRGDFPPMELHFYVETEVQPDEISKANANVGEITAIEQQEEGVLKIVLDIDGDDVYYPTLYLDFTSPKVGALPDYTVRVKYVGLETFEGTITNVGADETGVYWAEGYDAVDLSKGNEAVLQGFELHYDFIESVKGKAMVDGQKFRGGYTYYAVVYFWKLDFLPERYCLVNRNANIVVTVDGEPVSESIVITNINNQNEAIGVYFGELPAKKYSVKCNNCSFSGGGKSGMSGKVTEGTKIRVTAKANSSEGYFVCSNSKYNKGSYSSPINGTFVMNEKDPKSSYYRFTYSVTVKENIEITFNPIVN